MPEPRRGEVILYETAQGAVRIEIRHEGETFWLIQRQTAQLFGVDLRTVSHRLRQIYASGNLLEEAIIRDLPMVRMEGLVMDQREPTFDVLDLEEDTERQDKMHPAGRLMTAAKSEHRHDLRQPS